LYDVSLNDTLEGKTCLVSGSGNVAQYTVEKLIELGGKVEFHSIKSDSVQFMIC